MSPDNFTIDLPREAVKQPEPAIVEGGDCGACVLAGLFGISVEDAYDKVHSPGPVHGGDNAPKRSTIHPRRMFASLDACEYVEHMVGGFIEIKPLEFLNCPEWRSFGDIPHFNAAMYFDMYHAFMSAGYYRLCAVRNDGRGLEPDGMLHQTNHWVMLNGIRGLWVDNPNVEDSRKYATEVRISNSALGSPDYQWISLRDFLKRWGGMVGVWVLPKTK